MGFDAAHHSEHIDSDMTSRSQWTINLGCRDPEPFSRVYYHHQLEQNHGQAKDNILRLASPQTTHSAEASHLNSRRPPARQPSNQQHFQHENTSTSSRRSCSIPTVPFTTIAPRASQTRTVPRPSHPRQVLIATSSRFATCPSIAGGVSTGMGTEPSDVALTACDEIRVS